MELRNLPLIRPVMPRLEEVGVFLEDAYRTRQFSNGGPVATKFESEIAQYLGIGKDRKCLLVGNCTLGLMLAIKLFVCEKKPYVLMPSFTFAATALAAHWAGGIPYFVDIDPWTWCMRGDMAWDILSSRNDIACVVPVHTFGAPCAIDDFDKIRTDLGVPVLYDAAAAFGATASRRGMVGHIGGFGDMEIFSFHATKVLPVGEGGLIVCDGTYASTIEAMRNFGFDSNRVSRLPGFNAKMPEVSAAYGRASLRGLDKAIERRAEVVAQFRDATHDLPIEFQNISRHGRSTFQILAGCVDKRAELASLLYGRYGVETRTYYDPPMHAVPMFSGGGAGSLECTERVADSVMNFPLYSDMVEEEVDYLIWAVRKAMAEVY